MKNVFEIHEGEIKNETEAFERIRDMVLEINTMTDKVTNLLKHVRYQSILLITLFFWVDLPTFINVGLFSIIVVTFFITSNVYQSRKVGMINLHLFIIYLENKGIITSENKEKLKNFQLNYLWFE